MSGSVNVPGGKQTPDQGGTILQNSCTTSIALKSTRNKTAANQAAQPVILFILPLIAAL
jgi:hypothetical protein